MYEICLFWYNFRVWHLTLTGVCVCVSMVLRRQWTETVKVKSTSNTLCQLWFWALSNFVCDSTIEKTILHIKQKNLNVCCFLWLKMQCCFNSLLVYWLTLISVSKKKEKTGKNSINMCVWQWQRKVYVWWYAVFFIRFKNGHSNEKFNNVLCFCLFLLASLRVEINSSIRNCFKHNRNINMNTK